MAKIRISKDFKKAYEDAKKNMQKKMRSEVKKEIVSAIQKGISPVSGKGRFANYSISYQGAIKKGYYSRFAKALRPVNLTLSGQMLKSIKDRVTSKGFTIRFSDKKAKYHNEKGAGKSRVVRRMLPVNNEKLSRAILSNIEKIFKDIVKKSFKR